VGPDRSAGHHDRHDLADAGVSARAVRHVDGAGGRASPAGQPIDRPHVDQLLRAVSAISADLDEGYSRSSGRERAHYYEYAVGSAREARGWYYKCAAAFAPEVVTARLARLSRIIRILTAVIPRERERRAPERTGRTEL
jgi:four helix bundle protein